MKNFSMFLAFLVASIVNFPVFAGDTDIHFAGDEGQSSKVVSGDVSPAGDGAVHFRGDDAKQSADVFNDIVTKIEGQLDNTMPAKIVIKTADGEEVTDIQFAILILNDAVYLVAELPDSTELLWTLSEE